MEPAFASLPGVWYPLLLCHRRVRTPLRARAQRLRECIVFGAEFSPFPPAAARRLLLREVLQPQRTRGRGGPVALKSARQAQAEARRGQLAARACGARPCRSLGTRAAAPEMRQCGLRYSSHTAWSGLGLARAVRRFVWPRHANGMLATTPLDPCACEMSAQGGNTRRTGHAEHRAVSRRHA